MTDFRYIDDIVDWLEPMDYETFWEEVRPFCLVMIPKKKCDTDIEGGVDETIVLEVLKSFARLELSSILKLEWCCDIPERTLH